MRRLREAYEEKEFAVAGEILCEIIGLIVNEPRYITQDMILLHEFSLVSTNWLSALMGQHGLVLWSQLQRKHFPSRGANLKDVEAARQHQRNMIRGIGVNPAYSQFMFTLLYSSPVQIRLSTSLVPHETSFRGFALHLKLRCGTNYCIKAYSRYTRREHHDMKIAVLQNYQDRTLYLLSNARQWQKELDFNLTSLDFFVQYASHTFGQIIVYFILNHTHLLIGTGDLFQPIVYRYVGDISEANPFIRYCHTLSFESELAPLTPQAKNPSRDKWCLLRSYTQTMACLVVPRKTKKEKATIGLLSFRPLTDANQKLPFITLCHLRGHILGSVIREYDKSFYLVVVRYHKHCLEMAIAKFVSMTKIRALTFHKVQTYTHADDTFFHHYNTHTKPIIKDNPFQFQISFPNSPRIVWVYDFGLQTIRRFTRSDSESSPFKYRALSIPSGSEINSNGEGGHYVTTIRNFPLPSSHPVFLLFPYDPNYKLMINFIVKWTGLDKEDVVYTSDGEYNTKARPYIALLAAPSETNGTWRAFSTHTRRSEEMFFLG